MQTNSNNSQSQVTKLETQLKTVKDEKIKAEIQKKIETLKTGKPVTK
jgi:putative component of toxin-antitoxin plasmid stabilization module